MGLWGGSRNTPPLHGLATVSAGSTASARALPHTRAEYVTDTDNTAEHCARHATTVTQHDFAACPRTRVVPVKFSTRHGGYPVGFVNVTVDPPWVPNIPHPAAGLYVSPFGFCFSSFSYFFSVLVPCGVLSCYMSAFQHILNICYRVVSLALCKA